MGRVFRRAMREDARLIHVATKGRHAWYQNKFMWLFIFLFGALVYYPYSTGSTFRYYAYRALFCVVILFTVYALSLRRSLLVIALVLAAPSIIQHTVYFAENRSPGSVVNSFIALAFDIFTFCDSTGRVQTYSVSGVVRDKHGQNTFLEFSPPADEVPGLRPTRMNLTWDGSSVLRGGVPDLLCRWMS